MYGLNRDLVIGKRRMLLSTWRTYTASLAALYLSSDRHYNELHMYLRGKQKLTQKFAGEVTQSGFLQEWGKGNIKMNETHSESYLHLMFSCCSWFRSHGSPNKHSMLPIECFINQWYSHGPAPSKQDGINWHSFWVFPWRVNNGALGCRWTESVSIRTGWGSYAH